MITTIATRNLPSFGLPDMTGILVSPFYAFLAVGAARFEQFACSLWMAVHIRKMGTPFFLSWNSNLVISVNETALAA